MKIFPNISFRVTLLHWLVLTFSTWGVVRLIAAFSFRDVLTEFDSHLSPVYFSVTGAGWACIGGVLFWKILSRKPNTPQSVVAAIVLWQIHLWVERLGFQEDHTNVNFSLIASFAFSTVATAIALHPSMRSHFIKSEEHEKPDQHSETT